MSPFAGPLFLPFSPQNFAYCRIRQYPLYNKMAPPDVLTAHFKGDTFAKSQRYGKDKAKFSIVSGLLKQAIDSALIQYGLYAWSWTLGGVIIAKLGYGPEYQVGKETRGLFESHHLFYIDSAITGILLCTLLPFFVAGYSSVTIQNICSGRKTRIQ